MSTQSQSEHSASSEKGQYTTSKPNLNSDNIRSDPKPKFKLQKKGKGDTHFICIPLVTPTSIPQLATSLAKFREQTTAPRSLRPSELRKLEKQREQETPERNAEDDAGRGEGEHGAKGASEGEVSSRGQSEGQRLNIIPDPAHRLPGTFHLTLGVMNLSDPAEMRRALAVLKGIDFVRLLREAQEHVDNGRATNAAGSEQAPQEEGVSAKVVEKVKEGATKLKEAAATTGSLEEVRPKGAVQDDEEIQAAVGETETSSSAATKQESVLESLQRPLSPPPLTKKPSAATTSAISTTNEEATQISPITIDLVGVGTFPNPSGAKARVFYAHPHEHPVAGLSDGRLLRFANAVRQKFKDAGFVTETRELTLHATVANMLYARKERRGRGGRGRRGGRGLDTVDARALVGYFGGKRQCGKGDTYREETSQVTEELGTVGERGFVWAKDIIIDRVRICKMGAQKSGDPVLGMVYDAISVPAEGGEGKEGDEDADEREQGEVAEVGFG